MLNEESRKYFNRVYFSSCSAFSYIALNTNNHVKRMQEYSHMSDMNALLEYLKTTKSDILMKCHMMESFDPTLISPWVPTIESPDTAGAFMTEMPIEVYKAGKVKAIDTLVSFNSHVRIVQTSPVEQTDSIGSTIELNINFISFQEYISFIPELTKITEPLLKDDLKEFKLHLPFKDLNEDTHPEVIRIIHQI